MSDYALCPFYEYEKAGVLHCECKKIAFPTRPERNMWMKMHCNSWNFKICKFYTEIIKNYRNI